jgi:hypothetical protein
MTISPATTSSNGTCPAWCDSDLHDYDGTPHNGGGFDIQLSLAEPLEVPIDGVAPVGDWLSVALWQYADAESPVIDLSIHNEALSDLTIAEAEVLGNALLELARQAKAA